MYYINASMQTHLRMLMLASFILLMCGISVKEAAALNAFKRDIVLIQNQEGDTHTFDVELALSPQQRSVGLMFRVYLPQDQGMLFDFEYPQQASMWMKNTMVPLDILFIRSDGVISSIIQNAEPLTLTPRASKGEVRAVLEVLGGTTERLGIKAGDYVRHQIFVP